MKSCLRNVLVIFETILKTLQATVQEGVQYFGEIKHQGTGHGRVGSADELSQLQRSKLRDTVELYSHLVLGERRKEFTIKVRGDDDPPRRLWVLGRNNVREGLQSVRSLVRERILFYMPIELLQRVNDIIPDLSIVRGVRCSEE